MTWKIEFSIGGALVLGIGLRYREIMVIPLENCSNKIESLRARRNDIPT